MPRVLVVDDEPRIVEALCRLLKLESYDAEGAPDGDVALKSLARGGFDAVLLDLDMPRLDGIATLKALRAAGDRTPVIIVSGRGSIQRAVEAVKLGAHDFVEKPVDDERLLLSLKRAIEYTDLSDEVAALREDSKRLPVVAESPALRAILVSVPRIAQSGSAVLVTGETGVGKEVIAQLVHESSARRDKPFVRVNCAALSENLVESELFGHVRGAFTGALRDHKGRFQLAHGGTLFLDEVGEIPLALQPKLLRALGEGEFQPIGADRTLRADVRVIAATNRDLDNAVAVGTFRSDLYYRLAILVIKVPPLRERPEDTVALAEHFLAGFRRKLARPGLRFLAEASEQLRRYDWPGNVRELRNIVERLAVTAPDDEIGAAELEEALPAATAIEPSAPELADSLAQEEARLLRKALKDANGNVSAAARALGLERSHFYKKLKRQAHQ